MGTDFCDVWRRKTDFGKQYPFTGSIKQVKLYNEAASEDQILADHGAVSVGTPIFTYQRKTFDGTEGKMVQLPEQKETISGLKKERFLLHIA